MLQIFYGFRTTFQEQGKSNGDNEQNRGYLFRADITSIRTISKAPSKSDISFTTCNIPIVPHLSAVMILKDILILVTKGPRAGVSHTETLNLSQWQAVKESMCGIFSLYSAHSSVV